MAAPLAPAFLGAAAGLAGGIFSDRQRTKDHKRQLAHNAYWNSNKYQHTVRDLQAAGLNPALAYRQGASAQTSASAPSRSNIGAETATSAKETALLSAQIKNIEAETRLADAKTQTEAKNVPLREAEEGLATQRTAESGALTEKASETARQIKFRNDQIQHLNDKTGLNLSSTSIKELLITQGSPLYGWYVDAYKKYGPSNLISGPAFFTRNLFSQILKDAPVIGQWLRKTRSIPPQKPASTNGQELGRRLRELTNRP